MIQWILYSISFWPEAASAISWSGGIPKSPLSSRLNGAKGNVAISAFGRKSKCQNPASEEFLYPGNGSLLADLGHSSQVGGN